MTMCMPGVMPGTRGGKTGGVASPAGGKMGARTHHAANWPWEPSENLPVKRKQCFFKKASLFKFIDFGTDVKWTDDWRVSPSHFHPSPCGTVRWARKMGRWKDHKNAKFFLLFVKTPLNALGGNGFHIPSIHLEYYASEQWGTNESITALNCPWRKDCFAHPISLQCKETNSFWESSSRKLKTLAWIFTYHPLTSVSTTELF